MSLEEQEFARLLVNPEKNIRDKTLKILRKYLSSLNNIDTLEMAKLWKALFYCMWLADQSHVHTELSHSLANLIDSFTNKSIIFNQFFRTFFQIILREWHHLDQYRLNKFYTLIRILLRKSFNYLYSLNWPIDLTNEFLDVIKTEILIKKPNGPRYHLCDIYLPELLVATKGDINSNNFILLLQPFFSILGFVDDDTFHSRMFEKIFNDYYSIYAREHFKDVTKSPENGHSLVQHEEINGHISSTTTTEPEILCFPYVATERFQMAIFEAASTEPQKGFSERYRKRIYSLHSNLQLLTKIPFVDEDILKQRLSEIPSAPSDRIITSNDNNNNNNNKKKEKKNKKQKKAQENENSEVTSTITQPVSEIVTPVTTNSKKSKKVDTTTTPVEVPITTTTTEEKNVTLKENKQQKNKNKKGTVNQNNENSSTSEPIPTLVPFPDPTPTPVVPETPPPPAPYIASKTFAGAKVGYVFKRGPKGVGYYIDQYYQPPVEKNQKKSQKKRSIQETEETPNNNSNNNNHNSNNNNNEKLSKKAKKEAENRVRFGQNQAKDYTKSIEDLKTFVPPTDVQPPKPAIKVPKANPTTIATNSKKNKKQSGSNNNNNNINNNNNNKKNQRPKAAEYF